MMLETQVLLKVLYFSNYPRLATRSSAWQDMQKPPEKIKSLGTIRYQCRSAISGLRKLDALRRGAQDVKNKVNSRIIGQVLSVLVIYY